MGRTINKYSDDDEGRRKNKLAKHSRNIPGRGMRVINSWSEEDEIELNFNDDVATDDEYYDNTSLTQRNKRK
jgi:hypothetical protein